MISETSPKTFALSIRALLEAIDVEEDFPFIRGMTDGSEADLRSMSEVDDKGCFTVSLTDGSRFKIKVEAIL